MKKALGILVLVIFSTVSFLFARTSEEVNERIQSAEVAIEKNESGIYVRALGNFGASPAYDDATIITHNARKFLEEAIELEQYQKYEEAYTLASRAIEYAYDAHYLMDTAYDPDLPSEEIEKLQRQAETQIINLRTLVDQSETDIASIKSYGGTISTELKELLDQSIYYLDHAKTIYTRGQYSETVEISGQGLGYAYNLEKYLKELTKDVFASEQAIIKAEEFINEVLQEFEEYETQYNGHEEFEFALEYLDDALDYLMASKKYYAEGNHEDIYDFITSAENLAIQAREHLGKLIHKPSKAQELFSQTVSRFEKVKSIITPFMKSGKKEADTIYAYLLSAEPFIHTAKTEIKAGNHEKSIAISMKALERIQNAQEVLFADGGELYSAIQEDYDIWLVQYTQAQQQASTKQEEHTDTPTQQVSQTKKTETDDNQIPQKSDESKIITTTTTNTCTLSSADQELIVIYSKKMTSFLFDHPDKIQTIKLKIEETMQRVSLNGRVGCILQSLHIHIKDIENNIDERLLLRSVLDD